MKTKTKKHILLVISGLVMATTPGHAQINGPLPIIWQATYGPEKSLEGVGWAVPFDFVQTSDGGFLIAGATAGPANGIRTDPVCNDGDAWVIKVDAQGQRQWDRSHGGNAFEEIDAMLLTPDGGYLLVGLSLSPPGCLKTAPIPGMWVVRGDANGNALWDRSYLPAGFTDCFGYDCVQTADGAYLACGREAAYVIVKFDDAGQQLWIMTLGTLLPRVYFQLPLGIMETDEGGFVVVGSSNSPPSDQKSSPYYGGLEQLHLYRGSDFWVVRVDAQRNKLWDRSYGGEQAEQAYGIVPAPDGGFLVFGSSQSPRVTDPSKGTKTSLCYGGQDFWIVRLDAQGNQLWDKSYGGTADDLCSHAEPMPDGGWLLSGQSSSLPYPPGGKSSPNFGGPDFWIVRIDDQGNRLWDQSFGGDLYEGRGPVSEVAPIPYPVRIKRTADGGFLLAGQSDSPVSGLKTAPLISQADFWVLKLDPEPPFLRAEVTAEGQFQLCLIAPPEFSHTIQGSADLVAWMDLVTLGPTPAGKEYWTDQEKLTHRFYRAVRVP